MPEVNLNKMLTFSEASFWHSDTLWLPVIFLKVGIALCNSGPFFRAGNDQFVQIYVVDQPSRPISTVERINSTNDDDDQMLITERQATGSMTCKPEIKALCEEKGQHCTKHLWVDRVWGSLTALPQTATDISIYRGVYHCFIPGRCSGPCQNGGLCFNGRWVLWHLFASFASFCLISLQVFGPNVRVVSWWCLLVSHSMLWRPLPERWSLHIRPVLLYDFIGLFTFSFKPLITWFSVLQD